MSSDNILADQIQVVPLDSLVPYEKNPRIGDVGAIAESLEKNQQYRPIVVQASTMQILAGNHTWQAARYLDWEEISVVLIDVDDEQAKRIVLADNRTNDLAGYDASVLTEILDSLPDVSGTGYSQSDLDVLMDQLGSKDEEAEELVDQIIRPHNVRTLTDEEVEVDELEDAASSGGSVGGVNRPNFVDDKDIKEVSDSADEDEQEQMQMLRAELEGYEEEIWKTRSRFGIPLLAKNMLVEEVPEVLDTWVGASHHSQEEIKDENRWWFYNYSVGIRDVPFERSILAFHVYDEKFENWWHLPSYYVARFYLAGIRNAVTPDFSMWTEWPEALVIYNQYRNFWLGRFFQQAGWRVIPNIAFSSPKTYEYIWDGIPENPPVASMQMQTLDEKSDPGHRKFGDGFRTALEKVRPEQLILYTGNSGAEVAADALKKSKVKPEVTYVSSFAKKKTDLGVFKKDRATGTKRSMTGGKPKSGEEEE